jgi:hypothetical protein
MDLLTVAVKFKMSPTIFNRASNIAKYVHIVDRTHFTISQDFTLLLYMSFHETGNLWARLLCCNLDVLIQKKFRNVRRNLGTLIKHLCA